MFLPVAHKLPSDFIANECFAPVEILITSVNTSVNEFVDDASPKPISPSSLLPVAYKVPSASKIKEHLYPTDISATSSFILIGVLVDPPSPS